MRAIKTAEVKNKAGTGAVILAMGSILLLFMAFFISLSYGSVAIPVGSTLKIIANRLFGIGNLEGISQSLPTILLDVRMPRVILAGMVGAALSVAGAAMQGLLKNPLADGSTMGVTAGGALGAVLSIVLGINLPIFPQSGIALMSILFSFLSLLVILGLSYKIDAGLSTQTIILTGVIFSMLLGSITSLLIALSGNNLKQVVFWSLGSFSGRGWSNVVLMAPFFIFGAILLLGFSHELNALSLGEEQAGYIGVNTKRAKMLILITVSILVGISVAVSGTIGFVGLVIPHMTRLLIGPDHRKLLTLSMVLGAGFLMLTDLVSRIILNPAELPIGVVTSFIGSVIFIYIFTTQSRRRSQGD